MRPTRLAHLAWATAIACAVTAVTTTSTAVPADDPGRPIVGSVESLKEGDSMPTRVVTLISGHRVRVSYTPDGAPSATLLPGADGVLPVFETWRNGDDLYVFPATVADAVEQGKIDREFFNVTGLIEQGYDDARTKTIPVIAQYDGAAAKSVPTPSGSARVRSLPTIGGAAFTVAKDSAETSWAQLTNGRSRSGSDLEKLWLDRQLTATMAESNDQIGSPKAWEQGFDGTGSTVAVLDTGVDAEHPDLVGRITDSKDFTNSASGTDDRVGHGTHVASTVAGTGAASDGLERGVASGANLLIGKVLDDTGSGYESGIIAGMTWAVDNGADVVSMSLGASAPATACDDPIAQAVGELSARETSLFVIAAGNIGAAQNSVSSPGCAPEALTVGAVDAKDETAQFSSRGPVTDTHVLKPEIAAPGVAILAASAGGRGVYAYQSMSGTSMATPHVAGAAAIAMQDHPDLTASQLKDLLVSSADPEVPGDAREVGAGRVDVEALLEQDVTGPSSVSGGAFDYPQDPSDATEVSLTYINNGKQPVDLALAVEDLVGNDGHAVNARMISVPKKVTVPAGGQATVPVKVRPQTKIDPSSAGDVTAQIVATDGEGERVSTAYSMYVEPTTVTVRVKLVDRAGQPADGASSLDLVNTDTSKGERRFNEGASGQTYRVRPGNYYVSGYALTPQAAAVDNAAPQSAAFLARPQVRITTDTTIVLDARKAARQSVRTQKASEERSTTLTFERQWPESWLHAGSLTVGPLTKDVYADIDGKVDARQGSFEFGHWTSRSAPVVSRMRTTDGLALKPIPATSGSGNLDGSGRTPVVDAGTGTKDEIAAANVSGKFALIELAPGNSGYQAVQDAKAAGAVAVLLHHDDSALWQPAVGFGAVPVLPMYALPAGEAKALKARISRGPTTLQWKITAKNPYSYTLGFVDEGPLTSAQTHRTRDEDLDATTHEYTAQGEATDYYDASATVRPSGASFNVGTIQPVATPSTRVEYLSADHMKWQKGVWSSLPFGESMVGKLRTAVPGRERTESWYDGVLSTGSRTNLSGVPQLMAERQGSLIGVAPTMYADQGGHWADQGSFGDLGRLVLMRNGEEIDRSAYPFGVFEVPADAGEYSLTFFAEKVGAPARQWKRSTRIETTWTFRSQQEDDVFSRALPILLPRVHLPSDGLKRVAAGRVKLPVRLEANPGYDAGSVTEAKAWISTDGGSTWRTVNAKPSATGAMITVDHGSDAGAQVDLRISLTDEHGASVDQTVKRAYDVR